MSSVLLWKRDTVSAWWNKDAPHTVVVFDPVTKVEHITKHRNAKAAVAAARRRHKALRPYLFRAYTTRQVDT
ncbi:MAG TPA: hypothetical protein VF077_07325 [Nitrospiraceae bacterium]